MLKTKCLYPVVQISVLFAKFYLISTKKSIRFSISRLLSLVLCLLPHIEHRLSDPIMLKTPHFPKRWFIAPVEGIELALRPIGEKCAWITKYIGMHTMGFIVMKNFRIDKGRRIREHWVWSLGSLNRKEGKPTLVLNEENLTWNRKCQVQKKSIFS